MFPFFLTIVGVMFKSVTDLVTQSSSNARADALNSVALWAAVIFTVLGVLLSMRKATDGKSRLTILGIHALIWVIGYFLVKFLVFVIIIAVAAAFLTGGDIFRPLLDLVSADAPPSNSQRDDLEERREAVKQAVISKYGLHPSEVHVNSTADMVSINGEWKKVSDL